MTHNYEHWIETFSGHPIDPLNPDPESIHLIDIAHALSNQCRFSGHSNRLYSVAQHSVHVSEVVEDLGGGPECQLLALFHDASEAYLMDMPTPIKRQMPAYVEAEKRLQRVIEETLLPRFTENMKIIFEPMIKKADLIMLATEARDLMHPSVDLSKWKVLQGVIPRDKITICLTPEKSKELFISRTASTISRLCMEWK